MAIKEFVLKLCIGKYVSFAKYLLTRPQYVISEAAVIRDSGTKAQLKLHHIPIKDP